MNLRQIEIFVNVMKYNNFSQAAKKMYLTQPAISSSMDNLEKELGTKLYYYRSRKIQLTPAGERFLQGALEILNLKERTLHSVKEIAPLEGNLRIASHHMPACSLLSKAMSKFHKQHPDVKFHLKVTNGREMAKGIKQGHYDIVILGAPPKNDVFESYCVYKERMVLVTPTTNQFASLPDKISINDLQDISLITRNMDSKSETLLHHEMKKQGYDSDKLQYVAESNDNESTISLIQEGFGASILSEATAKKLEKVRIFEFIESELWLNFYATHLKMDYHPPYFEEFLKLLPEIEPSPHNELGERFWEVEIDEQ